MQAIVEPASRPKLTYRDWDPRYPDVARSFVAALGTLPQFLAVEHIGSTAIPGCGGKGVIDFMALYQDGRLEEAKAYFLARGFCPQGTEFSRPWPDDRPMYLGRFQWNAEAFVIYLHIVRHDSDEVRRFRAFKDRLRANPELVAEYCSWKRTTVSAGTVDSDQYTAGKGPFMQHVLGPN